MICAMARWLSGQEPAHDRATCQLRQSEPGNHGRLCLMPISEKSVRVARCGMKVANCVMLFAYERLAQFPIDVWIERRFLNTTVFSAKKEVTKLRLREFRKRILANTAVTRAILVFITRESILEDSFPACPGEQLPACRARRR